MWDVCGCLRDRVAKARKYSAALTAASETLELTIAMSLQKLAYGVVDTKLKKPFCGSMWRQPKSRFHCLPQKGVHLLSLSEGEIVIGEVICEPADYQSLYYVEDVFLAKASSTISNAVYHMCDLCYLLTQKVRSVRGFAIRLNVEAQDAESSYLRDGLPCNIREILGDSSVLRRRLCTRSNSDFSAAQERPPVAA